ncbi:MAG: hypothetical protein ACRDF5_12420 [bacterium]
MPRPALPEIFIIAPYYRRLNRLKETAYQTSRHQGLRPVLAEHDVEADLRWKRIKSHIRRARYVIAVFAALGQKGSGSQNIALETGFALAQKSRRRVGLFCHRTHRRNPLCFPTNLDGFDPVQFRSAADLSVQLARWIRRNCLDRSEKVGKAEVLLDRAIAADVAKGVPPDQARRRAEGLLRGFKRGLLRGGRYVARDLQERVQSRRRTSR